ncbi:thiamine-phosphate kinase [Geitlerinema sp. PCC 9228]|jgi:thiamine-monophosphate kinase|uniref:thiamine-phosphate kinase n=1 Tax=Geitlerinema sp. PCC 9228 TaxID=111611 RepID=UPI0008F9B3B0|nr:thiamine-phosphate kinase [Geitlerinema sp. PCC 9228]
MLVRDLGERALLQKLHQYGQPEIIGDDAAIVSQVPRGGYHLVVTTDMLVEEVHFSDRTTNPEDVGWRAVAANFSDLAAMGAMPAGMTVGLGVAGETPLTWVEGVYQGISEYLQKYQTPLLGGDVVRSTQRTLAITAFGEVHPQRSIRRFCAQPGDAIAVTGWHGLSRAGLELLLDPQRERSFSQTERNLLVTAHQRPQARFDVLPVLQNLLDDPWRIAGMDSSDGLADAVWQICQLSQVGARLDRQNIPVPEALWQMATPEVVWQWILYGGEDFELVLCLPPARATTLVSQLGAPAAIIGEITSEPGIVLGDSSHSYSEQTLCPSSSFQHFHPPPQ